MDRQVRSAWPVLLNEIARSLNPLHATMFAAFPMEYYWSTYQSEWATDILFRNSGDAGASVSQAGAARPDHLPQPGRDALPRPQGATRRQPATAAGGRSGQRREAPAGGRADQAPGRRELGEDVRQAGQRAAGRDHDQRRRRTSRPSVPRRTSRMRHQAGSACARGSPTCIAGRKSRRRPTTATFRRWLRWRTPPRWASLRHGFAGRPGTTADAFGRSTRMRRPTLHCSSAISRGEFTLNGFRNRDLRTLAVQQSLPPRKPNATARPPRCRASCLLLRAHHLIRKVPRTHRYHPDQSRAHRRHRTDRRAQCQHAGTHQIGGMRKSPQSARIFKVSYADEAGASEAEYDALHFEACLSEVDQQAQVQTGRPSDNSGIERGEYRRVPLTAFSSTSTAPSTRRSTAYSPTSMPSYLTTMPYCCKTARPALRSLWSAFS